MFTAKNLPIAKLKLNTGQVEGLPKNPRFIRDDQFEKLKKSIEASPEMLALREIIVYDHKGEYIIIAGNMRYRAMKELGMAEAPCKILDQDTPVEKLREYTIKDNVAFGENDWEALNNEWNLEELEDWGMQLNEDWIGEEEHEEVAAEDDFDEEEEKIEPVTKKGDIFELGRHRLMCGDSTSAEDVSKLMDGQTADLVVTDTPYNVAYEGKTKDALKIENDNMDVEHFKKFLTDAFNNMCNSLKAGGAFYVWYSSSEHRNFENALNDAGLFVREQLIWNKTPFVMGRQDYHWKHEPCLYGWKDGASHYFIDDRTQSTVYEDVTVEPEKMKKNELVDFVKKVLADKVSTTVIDEKKPAASELHPTMKPVKLIEKLVKNSSRTGEIVLDLFGGSGTTIITCEQISRKCNSMEYDPHYCDVIIARWEKLTGKKAKKVNK